MTTPLRPRRAVSATAPASAALATAVSLLALGASPAHACGGLFCNTLSLLPVDQSSEQIVFVVGPDEITAHVQIVYTGEAEDFAWVVPAPPTVTVEDSDAQAFVDLASVTKPSLTAPTDPCSFATTSDSSAFGCGGSESVAMAGSGTGVDDRGVIVFDRGETDTYTYEIVGAEDSSVLVQWLQDHGYNVGDNMIPAMQAYLSAEVAFVALKLRAGQGAEAIKPIAMTYPGSEPMVPLRLTAVAAQPRMGVDVAIIASTAYRPKGIGMLDVDPEQLAWRLDDLDLPQSNYPIWVARKADEDEGQLFVREYAGTPGFIPDTFAAGGATYVSRFYTRISPEQMTWDPIFEVDLSPSDTATVYPAPVDHAPVLSCGSPTGHQAPPCAFTYCGVGARCADALGSAHCECPAGEVTQAFTGPLGRELTCVPESNPLAVQMPEGTACPVGSCEGGTCTLKGGFPVCACPSGFAARLEGQGIQCSVAPAPTVGASSGAAPDAAPRRDPYAPVPGHSRFAGGTLGYLLLLGSATALLGRRRRREP